MYAFLSLVLVLLAGTGYWSIMKLRERLVFLEHEVRWLGSELESLKSREISPLTISNQALLR
jgi:hypothetical protein